MEGGRRAGGAGRGGEQRGTRPTASLCLGQHGQPRIDIPEPGAMEEGRGAGRGVEKEGERILRYHMALATTNPPKIIRCAHNIDAYTERFQYGTRASTERVCKSRLQVVDESKW